VKNLLKYLLLYCCFLICLSTKANHQSDTDALLWSIKNGSSQELTKFFSKGVALNLNGYKGEYSARQAEIVLKIFFKKYPAHDFILTHEGNPQYDFVHLLANYVSSQESFKVIIKGKTENERLTIFSLDIIRH
jgi:hypothetical protein